MRIARRKLDTDRARLHLRANAATRWREIDRVRAGASAAADGYSQMAIRSSLHDAARHCGDADK
jgi:hypothetical protein